MKLNKFEKIFIYVVILGLILIGGYFIFVHPYWAQIESSQKKLDANKKELARLNETLAPLRTGELDETITKKREDTLKLEGTFFPDMTTYETVEAALAYIQSYGFETHTISVNPISAKDLSLEYYVPNEVKYDLKTLAKGAKNTNDDTEVVEGQVNIGGTDYIISVPSFAVSDVSVTDKDGKEITVYNEQMQKIIKAGLCKYAKANKVKQKVGFVQATFKITGKYEDYVKLMDSIYSFDHRAMMTESVIYPRTIKADDLKDENGEIMIGTDESGYEREAKSSDETSVESDTEITESITLIFVSVEPMDPLDKVNVEGTDIVVNQRPIIY